MGTQNTSGLVTSEKTFGEYVREWNLTYPNAATKILSSSHMTATTESSANSNEKEEARTKDLSKFMAVAARFAFFAYKKPFEVLDGNRCGVTEGLSNGSTMFYLRKEALEESLDCVIKIQLDEIDLVPAKDKNCGSAQKSDPYVLFKSGMSVAKSETREDTIRPQYNSEHYLFIRNQPNTDTDQITLTAYIVDEDSGVSIVPKDGTTPLKVKRLDHIIKSQEIDLNLSIGEAESKIVAFNTGGSPDQSMTLMFSAKKLSVQGYLESVSKTGDEHWFDNDTITNYISIWGNDWPDLFLRKSIGQISIEPIVYIDQGATSTQAWFYWNKDEKILVLAFPGTDVMQDFDEDYAVSEKNLEVGLRGLTARCLGLTWKDGNEAVKPKVHKGYKRAYLSIRDALLETIYSLTDWSNDWQIFVTGHSLGGSLATLAAYDIANRVKDGNVQPKVALFTFGAPAVGDNNMVELFSESVPFGFRVVADDDVVATIGRWK